MKMTDKVYFVISDMHINSEKAVQKTLGRDFTCGTVSVEKHIKRYSKIILQDELHIMRSQYPDVKIVAAGTLGEMKYTDVGEEYIV